MTLKTSRSLLYLKLKIIFNNIVCMYEDVMV
uniref:Uncharacterized protein n=1 Tax=Porphyridium purpureum TaxID=35688 RepID=W0RZA4_PORPP|nr:hypothetical protein Y721_p088 [Porphyridium purpureum]BAO23720.1 hypothetical protein [Porphyridium purpureum]